MVRNSLKVATRSFAVLALLQVLGGCATQTNGAVDDEVGASRDALAADDDYTVAAHQHAFAIYGTIARVTPVPPTITKVDSYANRALVTWTNNGNPSDYTLEVRRAVPVDGQYRYVIAAILKGTTTTWVDDGRFYGEDGQLQFAPLQKGSAPRYRIRTIHPRELRDATLRASSAPVDVVLSSRPSKPVISFVSTGLVGGMGINTPPVEGFQLGWGYLLYMVDRASARIELQRAPLGDSRDEAFLTIYEQAGDANIWRYTTFGPSTASLYRLKVSTADGDVVTSDVQDSSCATVRNTSWCHNAAYGRSVDCQRSNGQPRPPQCIDP